MSVVDSATGRIDNGVLIEAAAFLPRSHAGVTFRLRSFPREVISSMPRFRCRSLVRFALLAGGLWLLAAQLLAQQVTPEQAAELILNSAKKAYNEKAYPVAVARFREYLTKYAGNKDAPAARYGLALSLLEGSDKDYQGALEQLGTLAGAKDFPDHPFVLYYLGVSHRGLGVKELAQIPAKPQEAPQRRAAAAQRFTDAGNQFAAATGAFAARAKEPPPDAVVLPIELEWSARARCDQAEMLLRNLKTKEAQATVEPFLKGTPLTKSRYRGLGLYYHGFASFLLGDFNTAGRSLNLLTPFADPIFGTHARYLLARTHHQADEQTEARGQYEAVVADYQKHKQSAVESLKQPDRFKNDPDELARLQGLVKDPAPDYVARSTFYLAVLQYEAGKFGDALARFETFAQQYPGSPLIVEAQLRAGFCQVQTKDFAKAIQTLQPLVDKEPRLADQALLWLGKAQAGTADPTKPDQAKQVLATAINTLKTASDRAGQTQNDPEAKVRRAEILLEMADAQQLAGMHKEAAAVYEQVLNEKGLSARDEEVLERRIAALHLAGDYANSDQNCQRFMQTYPKSTLLPAVGFRYAENAYFASLAAEKNPDVNVRAKEVARLNDEAAKRYQTVIEKFPEFPHVSLARYGLAQMLHRKGDYEKCRDVLETIPGPDRNGSLAETPYLLADCQIRIAAPLKADDAIAAGKLEETLQAAVEQLETFVGGDAKAPLVPDALIKLGHCYQRLAGVRAQPPEKAKAITSARASYERLLQQFANHPLAPQAIFERAKCIALAGDKNGAMNELRRFGADPLKNTPPAPMAFLQLASLLREVNQLDNAVKVLADCRQQYEAALAKDPERAGWATLIAYHHGVALREWGKFAEARTVFDQVVKQGGNRPEALDAVVRLGQCLHQEGTLKIDTARKRLATPNLKPEEITEANKALEDGYKTIRDGVAYFEAQVEPLKKRMAPAESVARVHYETAWGYRTLAEPEVNAVRTKMQQDLLKKTQEEAVKKDPGYRPPAIVALPDVPMAQVPLQPSEQKARAHYQALIAIADVPLAIDGRLELSELMVQRDDFNGAIALLNQALDKEPAPELTAKLRLRLGACLAAKKDPKGALAQFDNIVGNAKNPPALIQQAHYRAGEVLIDMGDFPKAAARLALFRDQGPYQNVPGVSDRALLRLGHAYAMMGQWDPSRQAMEILMQRFGNSPWIHEARYGMGWALQNQKQFDPAINIYSQVVNGTASEIGAKAQLQIGLCRLEQKQLPAATAALLTVPFTYDYPELSAVALVEAARAYTELKEKGQAEKLLLRVIKDHPQSKWAAVAKERLDALKKS